MSLSQIRARLIQLNGWLETARPAAQMWVFAATGALLTTILFFITRPAVEAHESRRLLATLHELMPETPWTPSDLGAAVEFPIPGPGHHRLTLYPLREGNHFKGVFLKTSTPEGYSGDIEFAMAVRPDGHIIGVRVLRHRETPGLGDWIEITRSDWVLDFSGKSLDDLPDSRWRVQKDGGAFDQFTGATITPRAVVKGVHDTLKLLKTHGEIRQEP